jgi:Flp pilus assembly protein TadG
MNRKQNGVALVEFALALPLLLILTFITTEFGRALYQYNILTKSVRDAARYLSTEQPWTTADANTAVNITVKTRAKNLVVYGNPAGSGTPLALELTIANVPLAEPVWELKGEAPVINTVTIKVTGYKFKPLISSAFGLNFGDANGSIPYGDISATMRGAL